MQSIYDAFLTTIYISIYIRGMKSVIVLGTLFPERAQTEETTLIYTPKNAIYTRGNRMAFKRPAVRTRLAPLINP